MLYILVNTTVCIELQSALFSHSLDLLRMGRLISANDIFYTNHSFNYQNHLDFSDVKRIYKLHSKPVILYYYDAYKKAMSVN